MFEAHDTHAYRLTTQRRAASMNNVTARTFRCRVSIDGGRTAMTVKEITK